MTSHPIVTEEMINAGVDLSYELVSSHGLEVTRETLVKEIYLAMWAAGIIIGRNRPDDDSVES